MKALQHLQTINHHKYLVMKECFEVGLYKQGLLHDMSKYSPTEFLVGCRYYQGNRSPNNAEREATGYSWAWLHHKGRNKHHYEYWIDYSVIPGEGMVGLKMPLRYVVEMFMDRIAASQRRNHLRGGPQSRGHHHCRRGQRGHHHRRRRDHQGLDQRCPHRGRGAL